MEINVKGFGGFVSIGLVALSGYVLYLKGKHDAVKEIREDILKTLKNDVKTKET